MIVGKIENGLERLSCLLITDPMCKLLISLFCLVDTGVRVLSLLCLLSLFSVFSCHNMASLFFNSQVMLGSQYPFFYFIVRFMSFQLLCSVGVE